ncbi:DUF2397 family protein [Streptomyces sp. NPDC050448]|uniref:DUF2397 family protein n=1 Tax=Streptomyces sp. NPDC050448 TaxID=3155404 RepID=UPI0034120B10
MRQRVSSASVGPGPHELSNRVPRRAKVAGQRHRQILEGHCRRPAGPPPTPRPLGRVTAMPPTSRQAELVEWGNPADPDTGRVTAVEGFYRKRFIYELTREGEAAEQAPAAYDEALGRGALQAVACTTSSRGCVPSSCWQPRGTRHHGPGVAVVCSSVRRARQPLT